MRALARKSAPKSGVYSPSKRRFWPAHPCERVGVTRSAAKLAARRPPGCRCRDGDKRRSAREGQRGAALSTPATRRPVSWRSGSPRPKDASRQPADRQARSADALRGERAPALVGAWLSVWTTTSNLIAVRRLLLEPDDPEVSGPTPEQRYRLHRGAAVKSGR
jgi:hypothetical protein